MMQQLPVLYFTGFAGGVFLFPVLEEIMTRKRVNLSLVPSACLLVAFHIFIAAIFSLLSGL